MAQINFNGRVINYPDGVSPDQVLSLLTGKGQSRSTDTSFNATAAPSSGNFFGSIDPLSLQKNKNWVDASRIVYKRNTGQDFKGSDADLAEYGLDQMGWFNYNLPRMALDAGRLQSASDDEKRAFLYLMETYDDLKVSWSGAGRFIKGAATDPINYVGLATFGIGTAASTATKVASKEGLKSLLKAGARLGIEGAMVNTAQDAIRQSVEIQGRPDQEFSTGRLGVAGATGFVGAGVLGGAIDAGATLSRGRNAARMLDDIPPPADTAPPPPAPEPQQLNLDLVQPQPSTQLPLPMDYPQVRVVPVDTRADWIKRYSGAPDQPAEDLGRFTAENPRPPISAGNLEGQGDLFIDADQPSLFGEMAPARRAAPSASETVIRNERDALRASEMPLNRTEMAADGVSAKVGSEGAEAVSAALEKPLMRQEVQDTVDFVKNLARSVSDGDAGKAIIDIVTRVSDPSGWKLTPSDRISIDAKVKEATELLSKLNLSNLDDAYRVFEAAGLTDPQKIALQAAINNAAKNAVDILKDLGIRKLAAEKSADRRFYETLIDKFAPVQSKLAKLYLDSSSAAGQRLQLSVGNPLAGENRVLASPDLILRNSGVDPMKASPREREAAFAKWLDNQIKFKDRLKDRKEVKVLEEKIAVLKQNGQISEAVELVAERNALINKLAEEEAVKQGVTREAWNKMNRLVNEYVISTVFTPSTTIVNLFPGLLKTVYKPLINYIADPTGSATASGLLHQYAAMASNVGEALKLAKMAFKYEQSIMTGDASVWLAQKPEIKGVFGRTLRVFPRILQATDEFFFSVNYRGFVVGNAWDNAIKEAAANGIKKGTKEYDAFIKDRVDDALKKAYSPSSDAADTIDFYRQQGIDRGYTGKALTKFVETEMGKNEKLMLNAENVIGKDYANDLLFRRPFSRTTDSSMFVSKLEAFLNSNALMRIGFQLFFRTPVRVFEEGVRLTPGFNFIAPKFIADLKGVNGSMRQVRAHGEAMMSMAFATAVLSLYANGAITGSGGGDWKRVRNKSATEWEPYTIYLGNGRSISYRNLDPFATPLKIIVNTLDNLQMHQYRKAQGANEPDFISDKAAILAAAGYGAFSALKDSGLLEGINQFSQLITDFMDPEKNADSIEQFFAKKLQLAVPNVIGKTQQLFAGLDGEPVPIKDPRGVDQIIENRFNPLSDSVSTQRDILGNKMYVGNPVSAYFGIGVNNVVDRDIPEKDKAVLREISDIAYANKTSFALPTKSTTYLEGVDLRERYSNGVTWYERISDIYSQSGVNKKLYVLLVKNKDKLTYGREGSEKGTKFQEAKQIIAEHWEASVLKFMREEPEAMRLYQMNERNKAFSEAGRFDIPPPR